ncbi:MAG: FAD-binding oxidoreductase, partial [Alphaproteobacteria bacterium]|nr:FAD-binding oxidoreductase [Alphaproteobacteria bacterium]
MAEHVDICIVGGGIVGLYCAAELAQAGFLVRLIDKHYIGSSRDNIGDITQVGHAPLMDEFISFSNTCWQESGNLFNTDLGLMPVGSVQFALSEVELEHLKKSFEMEKMAGIQSYLAEPIPAQSEVLGGVEVSEESLGAKLISRDLIIDTRVALNNLRQHLVHNGVRIWGTDAVQEFLVDDKGVVRGVKTDSKEVCIADTTIVSAGIFAGKLLSPLGIKIPLRPVRCHILEMVPNGEIPVQVVVHGCEKGFMRIRRTSSGKALVSYDGILDPEHSTYSQDIDNDTVQWMRRKAGDILPALHNASLVEARTVTLASTADMVPCIGASSREGLLLAVGMNGKSYAYAAGTARILRSILEDEPYPVNLSHMQPNRFESDTWSPIDMYQVLPTYQPSAKEGDSETDPSIQMAEVQDVEAADVKHAENVVTVEEGEAERGEVQDVDAPEEQRAENVVMKDSSPQKADSGDI